VSLANITVGMASPCFGTRNGSLVRGQCAGLLLGALQFSAGVTSQKCWQLSRVVVQPRPGQALRARLSPAPEAHSGAGEHWPDGVAKP